MKDSQKIEETIRKCTDRLGFVTEEQIQLMVEELSKMNNIKSVVDSLALSVDRFFGKEEQKANFDACMNDLLELSNGVYSNVDEILEQMKENKEKNYTPGNISVEENHELINKTLPIVCNRLNELGADYYIVGALSTFIGTDTPLFRYHGDIDFMVEENDLDKVREALEGTEYIFSDNRLNNQKKLSEDMSHTQGEHEVIANHKDNEFHLGFFLFRREPDNSLTIREYFMSENENGKKEPMVLERHYPKELAELEFSKNEKEYNGTRFRTNTPESVFPKKMFTKHPKDILDIEALKDKIDYAKIEEQKKYKTTLKIVNPETTKQREDSLLKSAIEATKELTTIGEMNSQLQEIKGVTHTNLKEKIDDPDLTSRE